MPHQKTRGECGFGKKPTLRICTGMAARGASADNAALQFAEPFFGPLADEFGGDVQVLGRAPVDARGRTKLLQKSLEIRDDFIG